MGWMTRLIGLLSLMLVCVGCAGSGGDVKFADESIVVSGDRVPYAVYTPANYDTTKKYPAVVFLHGLFEGGSDGKSQTRVGIGPAIQKDPSKWNCIVIMPQTPSNWQKPESVELAGLVLDDAAKRYSIDPKRITVTGLSNGGAGAWLLGAKYPGRFAGIAPLCAFSEYGAVSGLASTPVWAFHNGGDFVVGSGGTKEMVKRINEAGGNATVTIYGGVGHNCWDKAYADSEVIAWLQNPKRR